MRRVKRASSISSKLLMCGGGVRSMLLLPFVARCIDTIDICIWRMFVFMSVVVTSICVVLCCVLEQFSTLSGGMLFKEGTCVYVF